MAKTKRTAVVTGEAVQMPITADEESMVPAVVGAKELAINPGDLIAQAVKSKLPVETIERLLAMRRELKAEWAKEQYHAALAVFQSEMPTITKTKAVMDRQGKVRYRYAPLESIVVQVKELLNKHGFAYSVETEQGQAHVTAIMSIHHVAGHSESTRLIMPIETDSYMTAPQRVGSALTYAKRYAFCDGFGIMTADEDDDANSKTTPEDKPSSSEQKTVLDTEEKHPPKVSEQPKAEGGTAAAAPKAESAQPKGKPETKAEKPKGERKLPDDPVFKTMRPAGIETYWLLRDAYEAHIASKAYCEKQASRTRLNATNDEFLIAFRDEVKAELVKFAGAKEQTTKKEGAA